MNVVVVDNNTTTLDAINASLSSTDIKSQPAQDKSQFNLIDLTCVDCVLLDVYLGDWDGLEAIKRLKAVDFKGGILLVTELPPDVVALFETAAQAAGLNYWGVIEKPVQHDALVGRLTEACQRSRRPRANFPKTIIEYALFTNQMQVMYQPKIDMHSGDIVGFEALARLHIGKTKHPAPEAFLPLLERYGLSAEFNAQLICKSIEQLQASRYRNYPLSLNFSVEHLSRALAGFIVATAKRQDYALSNLTIEITEDNLVSATTDSCDAIKSLITEGVNLSLDDFGSGFNAYRQLAELSFNELKLDAFYSQNAKDNPHCQAILETACKISKKLGIRLVAEGVESEEQRQHLSVSGIDTAQGYLFGQPARLSAVSQSA